MAMTLEELEWVQETLALCEDHESRLSGWERNFIDDQNKRMAEMGDEMWLSPKQFAVLRRVREKIGS